MRLSDWRSSPQGEKVMTDKVASAYGPAMTVLGAADDPVAHIVWGDDPDRRYLMLVASQAGLIVVHVRVNVPQEGPRASAKLVRWSRVQVGELSVEAQHGHRHVTSQIENTVLQGTDDEADQIGSFVAHVLARIDGRAADEAGRGPTVVGGRRAKTESEPESNRRSAPTGKPIQLPATTDPA